MAGGKLTGYRLMARETLEKAAQICDLELGPSPEDEPPLPGGDFDGDLAVLEASLVGEFDLSPACAARLARLYGSEARELARSGTLPLVAGAPVLAAEVDWAVGVGAAAKLEDVVYRRLRTAWFVPGAREESVAPTAERMAALLGWDAERTRREIDGVRARLARDLAFLAESGA
jgi:glycerol-3-phosphate dehydrogenase